MNRNRQRDPENSDQPESEAPDLAAYLYEIGQLKRVVRSGWWLAGIEQPESVAEHSFRVAIIGYLLAQIEQADPYKTIIMCLFHDAHEARINDVHRVARKYMNWNGIERRIMADQAERLPKQIAEELVSLLNELEDDNSQEALLAHDADQLECLIQAREYQSLGYQAIEEWIESCRASLKSEAAKRLADECVREDPSIWWQGLKASKHRQ
jgi:putative hydrolases of HD superfamily